MKKILIIDDNSDHLQVIKALISDIFSSFTVYTATSGPQGIDLAKAQLPDVILLDILMPGTDGFEVCKILKEESSTGDIPVVFVTALKEIAANKVAALKVGADGFLTKPIGKSELTAQLNAMLKIKEANDFKKTEIQGLEKLVEERTQQLIDELKLNQELSETLRESEEKMRNIYSFAPTGIGFLSNRVIKEVNPQICEMTGYNKEELIDKDARIFYPSQEDYEFVGKEKYDQIRKKGTGEVETLWQKKDGSIINVFLASTPIDKNDYSKGVTFTALDISKRKKAEEALKETKQLLSDSEKLGKVGGWEFNIDTLEQKWTEETFRIHEVDITFDNTVEKGINFYTPDSQPIIKKAVQRAIEFGEPYDLELQIKTAKGHLRHVHTIGKIDLENRRLYGFIQDITERKQTEEALRNSEEKFRSLIESSNDGICLQNMEGKIIFVNNRKLELLGYTKKEELLGTNFYSLLKEEDQQKLKDLSSTLIEQGYLNNIETEVLKKDGSPLIAEVNFRLLRNEQGQPAFVMDTMHDITERKKAEKALKESESRFRNLLKNIPSLSVQGYQMDGTVIYWNEASEKLYGYTREEAMGQNLLDLIIPPEMQEAVAADIKNMSETRNVIEPSELLLKRKDNTRVSVFSSHTLLNKEGDNPEFFCVDLDLTLIKKAESLKNLQYNIARSAINTRNLNELFDTIKNELNNIIDARNAVIAFYNEETDMMSANVFRDEKDEISQWPAKKSLTGYMIKQNRSMLLRKKEILELHQQGSIDIIGTIAEAWLGVPLKSEDTIFGAIMVQNYDNPDVYDQSSIEIMELVAHELSMFIDRQRSEEKALILSTAVEQSSVSIVITNRDGKIEYVNPFFTRLTGFSFEEAKGHNPNILQSGYQSDNYYKQLWNTILSGNDWKGELLNKKKNGEFYWEKAVISPIQNSEGFITNFVAIKENITERKNLEEQLNHQNNLRKLLMEIATEFINISFEEVDMFIQKALKEMGGFVNADRAYVFDYLWELDVCKNTYEWCADGITSEIGNLQQVPLNMMQDWVVSHKKGESIYIPDVSQLPFGDVRDIIEPQGVKSLLAVPMIMNSNCIGFVGFDSVRQHDHYSATEQQLLHIFAQVLANVTLRRQIEKELVLAKEKAEESDRLKSAFLANMSHEIRTPMNGILGFLELLNEPDLSEEEIASYIQVVNRSGQRLLVTINDIIEFSKIESGDVDLHKEEVELEPFLSYYHDFFLPQAKSKDLLLQYVKSEEAPETILTDKNKLDSIFTNLIKNAIKFTEKGSVEFGMMQKEKNQITFYVKDSGKGIHPDKLNVVFKRFMQADTMHNRGYEGSGLGLSITKAYVEAMGGRIWVESEFGHGSCFYVSIPLEND